MTIELLLEARRIRAVPAPLLDAIAQSRDELVEIVRSGFGHALECTGGLPAR